MIQRLWRDLRSYFGLGFNGKTAKAKNPRRVEGGKKSGVTRKRNLEAKRQAALYQDFEGDAGRSTGYAG